MFLRNARKQTGEGTAAVYLSTAVGICIVLTIIAAAVHSEPEPNVIAIISGKPVRYDEVCVSIDDPGLLLKFRQVHERDPVTEEDYEELERMRRKGERDRLLHRIQLAVRQQEIQRLGITVDDTEARKWWEEYLAEHGTNSEEYVEQFKRSIAQLLPALKEVVQQGRDPRKVYKEKLTDIMSEEEWLMRCRYECTEKRLKQYERVLTENDDNSVDLAAFREMIVSEKLNEAIDNELMASDSEFAKYVRLAKENPSHKLVQEKPPNYIQAKRYEWWQKRYQEADIEIVDPRFRDVLESFNK